MMQELVQRVQDTATDTVNTVHTALPAKIISFDPSTCRAAVLPTMKYKKPDGKSIDYPEVTGVPVVFPQGAGQKASISFPVKAGDECLLVLAEGALDYWLYERETQSELRFDLTNGMVIPGLFKTPGPGIEQACAEDAVVVMTGKTTLAVTLKGVDIIGEVTIKGDVTVTGKISATGDVVGGGKSLVRHTHAGVHGETGAPT